MPLTIPNIESSPTFDGQAVPDSTDWMASALAVSGTGVASGCMVTQHTGADMAASVAVGVVAVSGQQYAVASGSVAIAAASSYDRKDIVVYTPGIGIESSGSSTTNSAACTGTPCGTTSWTRMSSGFPPVKPAIPAGSVLLSEIYVAYNTEFIATGNIIDKTTVFGNNSINIRHFPFTYNTANLLTGQYAYTANTGDIIYDTWVSPTIPFNGYQPQMDWGTEFGTSGSVANGMLVSNNLTPWKMWLADTPAPGNPGLLMSTTSLASSASVQSSSWATSLISNLYVAGPPAVRWPVTVTAPTNIEFVVSQDSTSNTATSASCVANKAASIPCVITTGTNDKFIYAAADPILGGGAAAPQTFQIAGGTYTSIAQFAASVGAAIGNISGLPFSDYCTVGIESGTTFVFICNIAGAAANGNNIQSATHDATPDMGFSQPAIFAGGLGGSPGATQGAATFYVLTGTPA